VQPEISEAHVFTAGILTAVENRNMSKKNALTRAKKRQALACAQADRIGEALQLYQKICEIDPRDAESWFMVGTLYGRMGRVAEAEAALRKTVALQPDSAAAYLNLGQTLELQGRLAEAEECFRRAVALKADLADAHVSLGRLSQQGGDMHAAIAHYEKAIQLNPSLLAAHLSRAKACIHMCAYDAAADSISQALRLDPDNVGAYYDLAGVRIGQGLYGDALHDIRRALQLKPDYVEATAVEAYILERLSDYQAALECLTPVLDRYQDYPEVAMVYASLAHFTKDYDGAIARLESLLAKDGLAEKHRTQIHFNLGQLYDKRGEYAQAFAHYRAGNQLIPATFDARAWRDRITDLIDMFSHDAMTRAPRADKRSGRPIFIVGMPRSGTTLVEQILSMYPEVAAAGELMDISLLADELQESLEHTSPAKDISRLSREQCDSSAQRYLDLLGGRYPNALRVTDKMPQNFLHLGWIALLFPGARVIHCVRDPMDTCLSCYFQMFTGDHPYAYDLASLGEYYRQYQRLMRHWRKVLDIPIFEVRYEDLVREPEQLGRAMVEFCGLAWDPSCLEFYKSERTVATASSQQVRRPIYSSSLGRWQHYADHLEPLKQALAGA
jgi:tetratricopeptide (TPR) repeat protein